MHVPPSILPPPSLARTFQLRRAIILPSLQPSLTFTKPGDTPHRFPLSFRPITIRPNSSPPPFNFFFVGYLSGREREKCLDIVFHRGDRDNVYRSGFYVEFIYLFFLSLSSCFASRDAKQIDRRGNLRTVPKISPRNSSLDESIFRISEGCSRWKYRRTDGFLLLFFLRFQKSLTRFGCKNVKIDPFSWKVVIPSSGLNVSRWIYVRFLLAAVWQLPTAVLFR